ncbi:MAG: hypothetical protein ACI841_001925, partial [Planctomycetota bacterium]
MKKSFAAFAALFSLCGSVGAQQIVTFQEIELPAGFELSPLGVQQPTASAEAKDDKKDEKPKKDSERTKRLKKLTFDRRPSVILAEWTKKPKTDEEAAADGEAADAVGDAENGVEAPVAAEPSGIGLVAGVPALPGTGPATSHVGTIRAVPVLPALTLSPVVQGAPSVAPSTGAAAPSASGGTASGPASSGGPGTGRFVLGLPSATPAEEQVEASDTEDEATESDEEGSADLSTETKPAADGDAQASGAEKPASDAAGATDPAAGAASSQTGVAVVVTPAGDAATGAPVADGAVAEEGAAGEAGASEELTEEEKKAAEEAAEAAEKAEKEAKDAEKAEKKAKEEAEKKAEADRKAAEEKALVAELELFQRNVTLGRWGEVKTYLASLEDEEAKAGYKQLLTSLHRGAPKAKGQFASYGEVNFYDPSDIYGVILCSPIEFEVEDLDKVGKLLTECVMAGSLIEHCIERLKEGLDSEDLQIPSTGVARILMTANYVIESGDFLPEPKKAQEDNDRPALNLLSRYYLAKYAKETKTEYLEQAWEILQNALADGEVDEKDKEEALKRAVEIAPRISEELGQTWLDQSFAERPERGMEILRVIGSASSKGLVDQARLQDVRFKGLKLQTTATNALIASSPELADEWTETLNLLATNWLKEAAHSYKYDTSTSRGPDLQRDFYGNYFYYDNFRSSSRNMPATIKTADLLDIRPSDEWLQRVDSGLRPKFTMVIAQLLLKLNEESEAFPYIETLAHANPKRGKELVEEFLRVWTTNHNPNSERQRTNPYMFIYGFEQRANGIPLTRSKQERNLAELSEWITRLRALPVESIDEKLIANAFTTAHSSAEVYRLETIESVFGDLGDLEPKTLSELVQKMRANLVGVWRQPSTQKDAKTNRKQKDIQSEVFRGYEVALSVIDKSLLDHPTEWSLVLVRASLMHDENNFRQEVEKSSEFAGKRQAAFGEFQRSAQLYIDGSDERDKEKESTEPFETWFYAALGACDLAAINAEKVPVEAQFAMVRDALEKIPGEAADRHMGMFANSLFTRMSNVNPSVKYDYVKSGLDIVGDHERAADAHEVFEYYGDLVTEIKLETRIDGGDTIAKDQPFGLFVDLRHTKEIEREAGGFSKYLINQNNQRYSYNYGRPTENYRDKFEEIVRTSLAEHFEVKSITFNHPEVNSQATEEYGWRVTPYAYLLLKPHGPEIDKIPSLRLDLDFLDTSGYAILPIESSPIVLDATAAEATDRPFRDLQLTQTLDERQANEGKLILEVQAKAIGLVPEFKDIL